VVVDSGIYSEMYEQEMQFVENHLETIISGAIQRLRNNEWPVNMIDSIIIDIHSDSEYLKVQGDPGELEMMFYYLLENSLEAVNPENPYIKITSRLKKSQTNFVEIEIFNTGTPVNTNDTENLFVPFYSTKAYGTGFGLPIAQLVVRKSLGDIYLEPVPGKGTKCVISLPLPLKTNNRK
jgi:signal transduction histidine kinase